MEYSHEFEDINEVVHNASVGIYFVNADGIILYANPFILKILGYTEEEYVGHNAAEFQIDEYAYSDMIGRLRRQEILHNYPAKVKAMHGIKYFLYNSSAYFKDKTFVHSRCFTTDISEFVYDVFVTHSEYYNSKSTTPP